MQCHAPLPLPAAPEEIASVRPQPAAVPKALYILDPPSLPLIYGPDERRELETLAEFYAAPQTRQSVAAHPELLAELEVIFGGWDMPRMDEAFLEAAPNLKAVFYGAGSIRPYTTEAFWKRGIVITGAYAANAVPVAEYTLATILLSLKNFWRLEAAIRHGAGWGNHTRKVAGAFRSTVALIGCGMIARRVIELLKPFDLRCVVYDPYLGEVEAAELGVERCTLEEAFALGDVVSLHAPETPATREMITGRHFSLMKSDSTFINTARTALIRQSEMIASLKERADITAVLDVHEPEPLPPGSPWFELPNVVLTPHIAGSVGPECQRLGSCMVEEFRRYLAGEPLRYQITKDLAARLA